MAAKRRPSKYNIVLKQFTKINRKLPEERKLSIKQRREIIKTQILPNLRDVPYYRVKIKPVKVQIRQQIELVPPREICDLNYIDTSEYAYIEWFALDETIREIIPDCVYVKISAGDYGETRIFNTRNYEYGRAGVRSIVEAIRPDAENVSGKYIFAGYQKLRPRKRNDGTPENYYLDFVLFIVDRNGNQSAMGSTDSVRFVLPKTREVRKKKTKIKNIIEGKIKKLKKVRDTKRRARKTAEKNVQKFVKISKRIPRTKKVSPASKEKLVIQFNRASQQLEKYFKEGKITEFKYNELLKRLLDEYSK